MSDQLLTEREESLFAAEMAETANFLIEPESFSRFVGALPRSVPAKAFLSLFYARSKSVLSEGHLLKALVSLGWQLAALLGGASDSWTNYCLKHLVAGLGPDEFKQFAEQAFLRLEASGHSDVTLEYLSHKAAQDYRSFIASVNKKNEDQKTVLFVTSRTDFKPLREAIALRSKGWRCHLVHLEPLPSTVKALFEGYFDSTLSLPFVPLLLQALLRQVRPDVIHVHCAMWHYHLGRIAIENKGEAICACEFNDITSFYADRKVMSDYWSPDLIDRDWAMERYVCNKADLLIHQWNTGMEAVWQQTHGGNVPTIEMQPYPIEQWLKYESDRPSLHDGVLRVVWAGQIPGRIACPPEVFDAYYLGEAIEKLLQQGFMVDAFQNPMFTPNFADLNFEFYRNLSDQYGGRFGIRPGVSLDKLPGTIGTYDYGLCLFDIPFHRACTPPAKTKFMMTNKLSTYFEAGIPIILNWEYESMADFVVENGLGIALRIDELDHVMEHIKRFDRDAAVERIKRYNRGHSMQAEIGRLLSAYNDAIRAK
jgi:hypothetical protein